MQLKSIYSSTLITCLTAVLLAGCMAAGPSSAPASNTISSPSISPTAGPTASSISCLTTSSVSSPSVSPSTALYPYAWNESIKEARIFGEGTISTPGVWENTTAISPDGKEFIFQSIREDTKKKDVLLYSSHFQNGAWSKPELMPFMDPTQIEGDPALSVDGKTLFFASSRPAEGLKKPLQGLNIWKVTRTQDGWGKPEVLGSEVNVANQIYPSVAANGNLYFTRNSALFCSAWSNGAYQKAEKLPGDISVDTSGKLLGFVDPKERFLLYFAPPNKGEQSDIWVSYNQNGKWTNGERLNEKVNTEKQEMTPYVSPDGRYLFFGRDIEGNRKYDIMQIDLAETGIKLP